MTALRDQLTRSLAVTDPALTLLARMLPFIAKLAADSTDRFAQRRWEGYRIEIEQLIGKGKK